MRNHPVELPSESPENEGFLSGKSEGEFGFCARLLNPIAQRALVIGLDAALLEHRDERIAKDELPALGKLAAILQSEDRQDQADAIHNLGLSEEAFQLVYALIASVQGWKGEVIR